MATADLMKKMIFDPEGENIRCRYPTGKMQTGKASAKFSRMELDLICSKIMRQEGRKQAGECTEVSMEKLLAVMLSLPGTYSQADPVLTVLLCTDSFLCLQNALTINIILKIR